MSQTTWSIDAAVARFTGATSVAFDLKRPSIGLTGLETADGDLREASILAVDVPGREVVDPPVDWFVRQNTIVAIYPPRDADLVRHQVRYAITQRGSSTIFDLLLSVQTSRLQSDPRIKVRSQFKDVDALEFRGGTLRELRDSTHYVANGVRPSCFLLRPRAHARVSIVALQHPSDFFEAAVSIRGDGDQTEVSYEVFPDSLEKGVIRRARFQHCLVPRAHDQRDAENLCETLATAAPVLNS